MGVAVRDDAAGGLPYDGVVVIAIAVEDYQNLPSRPAITPVHHARADAERFIETVKAIYGGTVPVDDHLLVDGNASLNTVIGQTDYIVPRLGPDDLFIFYYAGHGCQIGGRNRLTARDTNPLDLASNTIDLDDQVIAKFKASECTRALLFIDACAETIRSLVPSRSLIFDLSEDEIERKIEDGDYLAVYLSCSDGEKSYGSDALGHGIFTWHLLRALRGEDPRAMQAGRWITDVSLRDWLESEVPVFITTQTGIRGRQTPRAVLHAPHTFRIRHVPEPPATPVATLADLGLRNSDSYLEGVETGAIRNLDGFKRGYHSVPKDRNDRAAAWIGGLLEDRLREELDELFATAKTALGFKRRQGSVVVDGGDGSVDTPAFRFSVVCDQDPDDPADWRIRRRLELRDGWDAEREEIEEAIEGLDLDRFVVTFDRRRASYDEVADALEELADHEGDFDERQAGRVLTYARGAMSITFDFEAGEVGFEVSGQSNLSLVDSTRAVSLGWRNPSPMLAAPAAVPAAGGETRRRRGS